MSESNADTTAMLTEIRKQTLSWEKAEPGSREEFDAAEAATRVMAELDVALCDGAQLPVPWQAAQPVPWQATQHPADTFLSARGHEVTAPSTEEDGEITLLGGSGNGGESSDTEPGAK